MNHLRGVHPLRKCITAYGENNDRFDRVKRDSSGKNVVVRRIPREEGHSTTVATAKMKAQRDLPSSTGAPNPDDIAPRYITRDFMAYYGTV